MNSVAAIPPVGPIRIRTLSGVVVNAGGVPMLWNQNSLAKYVLRCCAHAIPIPMCLPCARASACIVRHRSRSTISSARSRTAG